MAQLDQEAPVVRQLERRGKRQRVDDVNEALAHALLETVRQALVGSTDSDAPAPRSTHAEPCGAAHHGADSEPDCKQHLKPYAVPASEVTTLPDGPAQPAPEGQQHDRAPADSAQGGPHVTSEHPEYPVQGAGLLAPFSLRVQPRGVGFGGVVHTDDGRSFLLKLPSESERLHCQCFPPQQRTASHDSAHTTIDTGDVGGGGDGLDEVQGYTEPNAATDASDGGMQRNKHSSPKVGMPGGPCAHCGTTESPQWRRPLAKKVVLCNACGIYFSRHHSLPKRKKAPGSGSLNRSARSLHATSTKEAGQPSIFCEEKLEADELGQAVSDPEVPFLAGQAPQAGAGPPAAQRDEGGRDGTHDQLRERAALSLPLMTTLPILGGINVVVQGFLHPNLAGL